jgi:hypothetical protein
MSASHIPGDELLFYAKALVAEESLTTEQITSYLASKCGMLAAEVLNSIDRECRSN